MIYQYEIKVLNVVDGDTLDVDTVLEDITVDYGFRFRERRQKLFEQRIRLYGINTPERGKPNYKEAGDLLRSLVMPVLSPPDFKVMAETAKPHEKYGRWLASMWTVKLSTTECPDVAQAIIDAGLGVPYFGGTK